MTVSSYGTNPQRRQDFEGKTIWRGQRQRRKKAHKHHAQAFLDVFLYIEISLAPLCVSNDNKSEKNRPAYTVTCKYVYGQTEEGQYTDI